MSQGEAKEAIARDEEILMDRARLTMVVVGETLVTEGAIKGGSSGVWYRVAESSYDFRHVFDREII